MNKEQLITETLLAYYHVNKRDLPWRHTTNPYRIWISEIMLQQTRVEAVKGYYERFMKALPSLAALASVEDDYLMKLWEGLGYYSRARNLKKAAIMCEQDYQGTMPTTSSELLKLPGIGKYTAAAIASISYGEKIAALDGNGLRVFARLYGVEENVLSSSGEQVIRSLMQACVPSDAASFNQAVMDFASSLCLPKKAAKCEKCPLKEVCVAYHKGLVESLPKRITKTDKTVENYTVVLYQYEDEIYLEKRDSIGLLAGLYGFPMYEGFLDKQTLYQEQQEICKNIDNIIEIGEFSHVFSHKVWKMKAYVIQCTYRMQKKGTWVKINDMLGQYALPTAYHKIMHSFIKSN